jgi:hypothetical protein
MGIKSEQRKDFERAVKDSATGKQKTYAIRIFANDDIYESTIEANRLTITENNIIMYNRIDQIIGIYPSRITEVLLKS